MSDRDARFISRFWPKLQKALGISLHFSTAFHPQTDGQSERTIQTLEDMLRAYILDFKESWVKYLSLAKFAYNNSYQDSIGMAPFEALYGRKCRTPVCWDEVGERKINDMKYIKISTERFVLSEKGLKWHKIDRKVMLTIDERNWNSKWMTWCFSR